MAGTGINMDAGAGAGPGRAARRLVILAASAGGLSPLVCVLSSLPADFGAAIVVVQHRSDFTVDLLPAILSKRVSLGVRSAVSGAVVEAGNVYVCPPGMHMTVGEALRVIAAPRLNFVRPSVDLMMQSAAEFYGSRVIAVVLSGTGNDGALGSKTVVRAGGIVIAQDPETAAYRGMPAAAAMVGPAQLVLAPEAIGAALVRLVEQMKEAEEAEEGVTGKKGSQQNVGPRSENGVTRVLVADDHQIIRDGLKVLLKGEGDMEVVGEAADGFEAVRLAALLSPDLVVMDMAMPGKDGFCATKEICERDPRVKVIALSAQTDIGTTNRAFEAGASGFLGKEKAFEELVQAIRILRSVGGETTATT